MCERIFNKVKNTAGTSNCTSCYLRCTFDFQPSAAMVVMMVMVVVVVVMVVQHTKMCEIKMEFGFNFEENF